MAGRATSGAHVVAILIGSFMLELSRGGPARATPSQVRNEDMMERNRELREAAAHEHLVHEAAAARGDGSARGLGAFLRRLFRR